MKIRVLIHFLTVFVVGGYLLAVCASAQTQAEGAPSATEWDRNRGPEPGKSYLDELQKDCAATRELIRLRPGASWNSEFGWAFEDQCEALAVEVSL